MKKAIGFWVFLFLLGAVWVGAAEYDSGVRGRVITATEFTTGGYPIQYPKSDEGKITVMEVILEPQAQTGWHKHPVPVYAYMLSGTLTINLEDGRSFQFTEGVAIIEVVNINHNGINKGETPVKLIVFYTGVKETPNVIPQIK